MGSETCHHCGQAFEPRRRDHRYCSAACRLQAFLARREAKCQERDAKVRMLLRQALEALDDPS